MVRMTIGDYLRQLKRTEQAKPKGERLPVPTQKELAAVLGIDTVTMSRISNATDSTPLRKSIGLDQLNAIIKFFHAQGFPVTINDLIAYEPD
jgi:DNA-binding Xre family transcriptional regulator